MRKIQAAVVALLATVGIGLVASPAQASFDWCHGASVVCFANDPNGDGTRWGPVSLQPWGRCFNIPGFLDNKIDSLWNKYGWDQSSPPLQLNAWGGQNCASDFMYTWGSEAYVTNIGFINRNRMSSVCVGPRRSGWCP